MTNEEAAQARDLARQETDRARQESSERASTERNKSSKDRYKENLQKNEERKQERNAATNALTSGSANIRLSEIARIGGPVGRKLEREIRNFQQTGRVSNWLAGETLKAEAAQNAAQQSAFRQAVTDVISTSSMAPIQIGQTNSYIPPLSKKPEIRDTAESAASSTFRPFQIVAFNNGTEESPDWKIRIYSSTLAGGSSTDLGFSLGDDPPYLLSASSGIVQGRITIDSEGNVTSRLLEIVGTLSENTDTNFYVEIGTIAENNETFTTSNSRYGPIDANICRDWFSNPPTYGVTFVGSEQ